MGIVEKLCVLQIMFAFTGITVCGGEDKVDIYVMQKYLTMYLCFVKLALPNLLANLLDFLCFSNSFVNHNKLKLNLKTSRGPP